MKKFNKIALATITVLVEVVVIVISYFYGQLNKVKKVEIPTTNSELSISLVWKK